MGGHPLNVTAKKCIVRHSMIDKGDGIVIGVSGGPDSVALLFFLLDMAKEYDLRLHIAHVNHMIRGADADADADYVEKLAESLRVPVTIERVDVPGVARRSGATVEDAGRSVRYGLFLRIAKDLGFSKVAVGHNADDQAETVLMRVIRGAGTRGLAGIPPTRDLGEGITLIRPLIGTGRDSIEAYCRAKNVCPRQDATNLDTSYFRNRVRRELLPLLEANYNSNIRASLTRLAATAADDEAYLRSAADQLLELAIARAGAKVVEQVRYVRPRVEHETEYVTESPIQTAPLQLDLGVLQDAPPALLARVLTAAFAEMADGEHDLYYPHVAAMCDLVAEGSVGDSVDLPRGVRAWLTYDCLLVGHAEDGNLGEEAWDRRQQGQKDRHDWASLKVPGVTSAPACGVIIYSAICEAPQDGAGLACAGHVEADGNAHDDPDGRTSIAMFSRSEWADSEDGAGKDAGGSARKDSEPSGAMIGPSSLAAIGNMACAASGFEGVDLDPSLLGITWVIFDAGKVDTENLAVRPWKAGDRLAPFGMEGTKKVSDVFIDEKIPKADRLQWPVIVYGDEVFWVVGLRASRIAVVDAKTRRYGVLVAEWDRD